MQGLPLTAFKKQADISNMGIRDYSSPNGESWKDVNMRARDFMYNEILIKYFQNNDDNNFNKKELTLLVVTHGGFIMEFINAFKYFKDPENNVDKFNNNSKNTSVTIF